MRVMYRCFGQTWRVPANLDAGRAAGAGRVERHARHRTTLRATPRDTFSLVPAPLAFRAARGHVSSGMPARGGGSSCRGGWSAVQPGGPVGELPVAGSRRAQASTARRGPPLWLADSPITGHEHRSRRAKFRRRGRRSAGGQEFVGGVSGGIQSPADGLHPQARAHRAR